MVARSLMMELEQRRETRVSLRVSARLLSPHEEPIPLLTEDVSLSGLFVRTDNPPAVGDVVDVEVSFGVSAETTLTVRGAVAHVIRPVEGSDRAPGAGVRLLETADSTMHAWQDMVREAEQGRSRSSVPPGRSSTHPDPVRRKFRRYGATLRATLRDGAELMTSRTADVSFGGLFVATEEEYVAGARVNVSLCDPETSESFTADFVVRRRVNVSEPRGIGLELDAASEEQCAEFEEFVRRRVARHAAQ